VKHNAALLRELAEQTGGRQLQAIDPKLVDLFDRADLEIPRSHRRIWDLLAMIAAGLFILDVAGRRLAVDRQWLASLFGRAVSRRGDRSEDTVAAWKRARSQVTHRREATEAEPARRDARFEAGESDRAVAIDVGQEPGTPPARPEAAAEPDAEAPPAAATDQDSHTSRLLRAKRRARGESGEPTEDDPDG
jgi:hypothetical protein